MQKAERRMHDNFDGFGSGAKLLLTGRASMLNPTGSGCRPTVHCKPLNMLRQTATKYLLPKNDSAFHITTIPSLQFITPHSSTEKYNYDQKNNTNGGINKMLSYSRETTLQGSL